MPTPTLRGRWRRLWRRLERELMPCRCVFCGMDLPGGRRLCRACDRDLVQNAPACRYCALPLPDAGNDACGACQGAVRPFTAVIAPFAYAYPLDAAIRRFKYRRKLFYAPAFGELLCRSLDHLPPGVDAVQPVPLHRWRQAWRGYNQARELALPVARALQLPVLDAVRRCRHTPYQSGLPAAERRRNLEGAFSIRRPIAARHVLLVDDVVTTASTCRQMAGVLRRGGVEEVSVLALARALAD